jgi:hypothetical protein
MVGRNFDSPAGSCDGFLLNQRGTAGTAAARSAGSNNAGPKRRTQGNWKRAAEERMEEGRMERMEELMRHGGAHGGVQLAQKMDEK